MKTTIKILAVLSLLLFAFNPYPAAGETVVITYKGNGVNAYFLSMDPTGCIRTAVYLVSAEEMLRTPPGDNEKRIGVYLTLYQYNDCTETRLIQASGYTPLSRSDFQVSGDLRSAHLTATVPMQDSTLTRFFDLSLDLTWAGVTDVYQQIYHETSSFGGCHENIQTKEGFRDAQASGTVLDGDTNLVPEPAYQATIFRSKDSRISHGCE